jgi:DNA-binding MarR family transcriptional regulator
MPPPLPPAAPALAEFEDLGWLIGQARRRIWNGVARVLAVEGEAVLGWAVVSMLARFGALSQRDLADRIGQHAAGISRQLTELDRAGLTTRTRDPLDRRRHLVALTPRGRRWRRRWRPSVMAAVGDVLGVLDADERAVLKRLLHEILGPRVVEPPADPAPSAGRLRRPAARASSL